MDWNTARHRTLGAQRVAYLARNGARRVRIHDLGNFLRLVDRWRRPRIRRGHWKTPRAEAASVPRTNQLRLIRLPSAGDRIGALDIWANGTAISRPSSGDVRI